LKFFGKRSKRVKESEQVRFNSFEFYSLNLLLLANNMIMD
jgi:hypothetical protein